MRRLVALLLVPALVPLLPVPVAAQASSGFFVGPIVAVLEPPFTRYSVEADGAGLTFAWSNSNPCGRFASDGARATWDHGDDTDCGHDSPFHPGEIRVDVGNGTHTVTRYYHAGSASGEGPTPASVPRCPASGVEGAFEPVQAVWQDDDVFADRIGKRLAKRDARTYTAELDMVSGKATVLTGIKGSRDVISLRGLLSGTVSVPAVVRFTLSDAGGERVVHEHPAGRLPIGGSSCGGLQGFRVDVPAALGVPETAFAFGPQGPYTITMELVELGGGAVPGTQVVVDGFAREVPGLRLYFAPVVLFEGFTAEQMIGVAQAARRIASEAEASIPDYYPLKPGSIETKVRPIELDLRRQREAYVETSCRPWADAAGRLPDWCVGETGQLAAAAHLRSLGWAAGADRILAVLRDGDFDALYANATRAEAYSVSTKVIYLRTRNPQNTVGHELAHSLPQFVYAEKEMTAKCGVDYHNKDGFGHGLQLTSGGRESRQLWTTSHGVLGPAYPTAWIEQCTYWHLLQALQRRADPPLWAVQGWIGRDAGIERAAFEPGLSLDGEPDLDAGAPGEFALVVRDAAGAEIARYGFDAPFRTDAGDPVHLVSFGQRIPQSPGAARIELEGPSGPLAAVDVTAHRPRVEAIRIGTDEPDGGAVVSWMAHDEDGDALTYLALVSADGGGTWDSVEVDARNRTARVDPRLLAPGVAHVVRVVASDGVWSAEANATFAAPARATAPGQPSPSASPTPGGADGQAQNGTPLPLVVVLAAAALAALGRRRA